MSEFENNKRRALRAVLFDVQGTCADFYSPLIRLGARMNARKGLNVDWDLFCARWRSLYRQTMDHVIEGRRPWISVNDIYSEALVELLTELNLSETIDHHDRVELNSVWTNMDAWPDSVEGLVRIRQRLITSTLSNASMSALVALVKNVGLPFDAILSAELAQSYKPNPQVYQLAMNYLGLSANQTMLVACHKYDLRAARHLGMMTAFIERPMEFGPGGVPDRGSEDWIDFCGSDFLQLADWLSTKSE